jgi:hypothetical protein
MSDVTFLSSRSIGPFSSPAAPSQLFKFCFYSKPSSCQHHEAFPNPFHLKNVVYVWIKKPVWI